MTQGKQNDSNSKINKLYEQLKIELNNGAIIISEDLKRSLLELKNLSELQQVELIGTLDKMDNAPELLRQFIELYIELFKLKQVPFFEVVPKEILNDLYEFNKDDKTLSSLALASREHHKLFQSDRMFLKFQQQVAYGRQDKVEALLDLLKKRKKDKSIQEFLCKTGSFTDYSGRSFECTAYEYAFWAKDTRMCRMLEHHMDKVTKEFLIQRCNHMEKNGLKYTQNGQQHCTRHFDLSPLVTAYKAFRDGYNHWYRNNEWEQMRAAARKIGCEQRELPAHFIHEYCNSEPWFKDSNFEENTSLVRTSECLRVISTFWHDLREIPQLLPFVITSASGLGIDFFLVRGHRSKEPFMHEIYSIAQSVRIYDMDHDCDVFLQLDKIRTGDIKQSLENLKPINPEPSCVIS